MICKICGKENKDTAKFCSNCGGKIKTEKPVKTVMKVLIGLVVVVIVFSGILLWKNFNNGSEETNNVTEEVNNTIVEEENSDQDVIIEEQFIDGVRFAAYYDCELTDENIIFLKELLLKCKKEASFETLKNCILKNNNDRNLMSQIRSTSHEKEALEEKYGNNTEEYTPFYHIIWEDYKVSYYCDSNHSEMAIYYIPLNNGKGYFYFMDYSDYFEYYKFDCKNGIPEGEYTGYEYNGEMKWDKENYYSGNVKNGLKNGRCIRKEERGSQSYVYCDFVNGKPERVHELSDNSAFRWGYGSDDEEYIDGEFYDSHRAYYGQLSGEEHKNDAIYSYMIESTGFCRMLYSYRYAPGYNEYIIDKSKEEDKCIIMEF